jgi:hypothetical protein
MAGFCVSCGSPMTGLFCNKCGARAVPSGAPAQAAPPPVPAPPAPQVQVQAQAQPVLTAAKSSGIGKILLWVGGILLVVFVAGAAAAVYGVYWVKHKVSSYASAVTGNPGDNIKVVASGSSCKLLSTADLQQVLGVTIEKSAEIVEEDAPGCAYYTNQQAFNQLRQMAIEQTRKQVAEVNSRPGPKPDSLPALLKNTDQMEGMVKALGMTQPSADGRVFSFTVQRGATPESWASARLVQSAVPGFEEVPGIGDHAMIGSFGHAFYVLKGDAVITMSTIWIPDARTRGIAIGQRIIGNL